MDRVQPLEPQIHAEAFMNIKVDLQEIKGHEVLIKDRVDLPEIKGNETFLKDKVDLPEIKGKEIKDEIIFTPLRQEYAYVLEGVTICGENGEELPLRHIIRIPRVIVTMENDPLDHFPLPDFDNLWNVSTFLMNYTGKSTSKILTPCGGVLFRGFYPHNVFCESCQSQIIEKRVEVLDPQNSDVMMLLKYSTPAYQICYEEVTTVVEILEPDGNLMATITQKKTWMNARISRDVIIQPECFGKANIYKADFNWNDTSVNFKTTRSGLIVATLIKNFAEKTSPTAYTLQILRDIKPRDKAILVGFMMARDLLMIDERQTRDIVDKMTAFFVFVLVLVVLLYFFI